MLPSFTVNLHCCKSGHCAPFLQQWCHSQLALLTACSNFISIYPNLFEFFLSFIWSFWVKRGVMWQSCLVSSESADIIPHMTQHIYWKDLLLLYVYKDSLSYFMTLCNTTDHTQTLTSATSLRLRQWQYSWLLTHANLLFNWFLY